PGEEVVAEAELHEVVSDDPVVAVGDLLRGAALPVGRDQDRGAVLIGAADHQHLVALQPVVARKDVRRHAEAGHVAQVSGAARVRPGNVDEDAFGHLLEGNATAESGYARSRERMAMALKRIGLSSSMPPLILIPPWPPAP